MTVYKIMYDLKTGQIKPVLFLPVRIPEGLPVVPGVPGVPVSISGRVPGLPVIPVCLHECEGVPGVPVRIHEGARAFLSLYSYRKLENLENFGIENVDFVNYSENFKEKAKIFLIFLASFKNSLYLCSRI